MNKTKTNKKPKEVTYIDLLEVGRGNVVSFEKSTKTEMWQLDHVFLKDDLSEIIITLPYMHNLIFKLEFDSRKKLFKPKKKK